MKLSKNRLHKIKNKKNHSRKKCNFRKKHKSSYKNTQKKHYKKGNLKNKTLKIYVGGGAGQSSPKPNNVLPPEPTIATEIEKNTNQIKTWKNEIKELEQKIDEKKTEKEKKTNEADKKRIQIAIDQLTKQIETKNGAVSKLENLLKKLKVTKKQVDATEIAKQAAIDNKKEEAKEKEEEVKAAEKKKKEDAVKEKEEVAKKKEEADKKAALDKAAKKEEADKKAAAAKKEAAAKEAEKKKKEDADKKEAADKKAAKEKEDAAKEAEKKKKEDAAKEKEEVAKKKEEADKKKKEDAALDKVAKEKEAAKREEDAAKETKMRNEAKKKMDIIAADVDKRLATQAAWATEDKEAEDKKATDEHKQKKGTAEEKLEAGCKELLKTPLPKADENINATISTAIKAKYDANNYQLIKQNKTIDLSHLPIKKTSDIYKVNITSGGDCLYDSVVFNILYKQKGKWNDIDGWVPKARQDAADSTSYIGNLRTVLQHYICSKREELIADLGLSSELLQETFTRIGNNNLPKPGTPSNDGWAQEIEIRLLARMFGVCIMTVNNINKNHITIYNRRGQLIGKESYKYDINSDTNLCTDQNAIMLYNTNDTHFESLVMLPETKTVTGTGTNVAIQAAKSLNKYECDPEKLNIDVPDTEAEAKKKMKDIDDEIIWCSSNTLKGPDNSCKLMALLEKSLDFMNAYEKKFGKKLAEDEIDEKTDKLFKEKNESNYELVPFNDKAAAKDKLENFNTLFQNPKFNNTDILKAMYIYFRKAKHDYPGFTDDCPIGTGTKTDAKTDANAKTGTKPDANANAKTDTGTGTNAIPLTDKEITNLFNKIAGDGAKKISTGKFINFITNKDKPDSILLRKIIGLDEPLTREQFKDGKSWNTNLKDFSKNSQIIGSLFKTFYEFQPSNENDRNKDANESDFDLKRFKQFVNCGQYRDKSKNIFDCKDVEIPKPSAPPESGASTSGPTPGPGASTSGPTPGPGASTSGPTPGPGAPSGTTGSPEKASGTTGSPEKASGTTGIPTATAIPVNSKNIELEINEKDFDGTLKRVDVSIFIPTDGEVIVRNYAKNNARETLRGIPVYGIPQ